MEFIIIPMIPLRDNLRTTRTVLNLLAIRVYTCQDQLPPLKLCHGRVRPWRLLCCKPRGLVRRRRQADTGARAPRPGIARGP